MATHLVTVAITVEIEADEGDTPWDSFDAVKKVLEAPSGKLQIGDRSWTFDVLDAKALAPVAP